jgi:AraC-like DNA-binding protein
MTKGELFGCRKNWQSARTAIRKLADSIFKRSNKPRECAICGYNKHIEIAHIKGVSEFSDDSLVSEINDINNLVALCPNHHWEFDSGQLSEEDNGNSDLLKRFHDLLQQYFRENRQLTQGLPTVAYCASELAYSPRYFGDIVHKATGGTAIGYIHNYVINQAKSLLMNGHNISETSRILGFDFPHHFARLFKKMTGLTPSEYLGK